MRIFYKTDLFAPKDLFLLCTSRDFFLYIERFISPKTYATTQDKTPHGNKHHDKYLLRRRSKQRYTGSL